MNLIFKLVSRYLTYQELISIIRHNTEYLDFYFNETLYLTNTDRLNIKRNIIPPPLWMRMYYRNTILRTISNNKYIDNDIKLQIYNGVKNNNPELLKLYHDYFPILVGNSIELYTDISKIVSFLPLTLGDYRFYTTGMGEFIIEYKGRCVGRNFFKNTIKIIKHYGIDHIITTLKSPLIVEAIATTTTSPAPCRQTKRPRLIYN